MGMPDDDKERKIIPICTGVLDYFPDALAEVAVVSRVGNEQHNPGEPLHWAKHKSTDEANSLIRHLIDRGKRDKDGQRHSAKVAWRALALLQREIDAERAQAIPLRQTRATELLDNAIANRKWCPQCFTYVPLDHLPTPHGECAPLEWPEATCSSGQCIGLNLPGLGEMLDYEEKK